MVVASLCSLFCGHQIRLYTAVKKTPKDVLHYRLSYGARRYYILIHC